ncbi:MAG TPA: CehA/McbA family metallohydrolase [Kofleriaceae bacterium]|nr:CehA/McbA family metallohydrolase [Kofleriaceae bacterium]
MRITRSLALLSLVACSSRSTSPPTSSRPHDATTDAARPTVDDRRWLVGDVHMHVSPPDDPADVRMSVTQIADAARRASLDFLVLTPHLWPARRGDDFDRAWRAMAKQARSERSLVMIPGVEWSTGLGHFTVAGVDVTQLGPVFLSAAHAAGALISVNHPFAVPTRLPGIHASHYDMSYRAWTRAADPAKPETDPALIDSVEVWNVPLGLANVISRPGGQTGEERAWLAADRTVHEQHRRIAAVGGTDNHQLFVAATTWVLAREATEAGVIEALRAGATCVGGLEAGTLRVHGDADPVDAWARVGDVAHAPHTATLAWNGVARLYIDGVDRGEHTGGFVHETGNALHTYRIVVGASRCGFVYANL